MVSHVCPYPPVHGNRTRFLALLRWLRQAGYRTTFILQPLDVDDKSGLSSLAAMVDRLEVIQPYALQTRIIRRSRRLCSDLAHALLPTKFTGALRRLLSMPTLGARTIEKDAWGSGDVGGDGHIDRWCWDTTCRVVRRAVRRDRPIAVLTEYALLSRALVNLPTLKLIDTVEVFFRNRERFQTDGLAAPFVCSPESEKMALARADALIAIQRNDAEALRALFPATRVITVSHTHPQSSRRPEHLASDTVLYVGSSNPFNVHGLQKFLEQAWASIVASVPAATLRIVGSVPPVNGTHPGRVLHVGRVSDRQLASEYQSAHVVINPQIAGTGLKIKCVEALSAGCPVVMNNAGADGLEDGAGWAFLQAEDWPEFASHVVHLMRDDTYRATIEAGAQRFASSLFSEEAAFSQLAVVLRDQQQRRAGALATNGQSQ